MLTVKSLLTPLRGPALLLFLAPALLCLFPLAFTLQTIHNGINTTHGLLLLGMGFGWLIWVLKKTQPSPGTLWAIPALLLGLALHFGGLVGGHYTLFMWSTPFYLAAITATLWGRDGLKQAWPALLMLFLSVPMSVNAAEKWLGWITLPERWLVAWLTSLVLRFSGVLSWQEGTVVTLFTDEGPFLLKVAIQCSGYGFLSALWAVILAYLTLVPGSRRLRLLLALPIVSILANALRVLLNALVAGVFGPGAGFRFSHEYAGYAMLFISALVLLAADLSIGGRKEARWEAQAR